MGADSCMTERMNRRDRLAHAASAATHGINYSEAVHDANIISPERADVADESCVDVIVPAESKWSRNGILGNAAQQNHRGV